MPVARTTTVLGMRPKIVSTYVPNVSLNVLKCHNIASNLALKLCQRVSAQSKGAALGGGGSRLELAPSLAAAQDNVQTCGMLHGVR